MLQLVHPSFQELALHLLVDEQALDTSQGLGDGVALLLEALESPVDLVEVTEDFAESFVDAPLESVETLLEHVEAAVDRHEALVDRGELAAQEVDELLVLALRHGRSLPHLAEPFKCLRKDTRSSHGSVRHGSLNVTPSSTRVVMGPRGAARSIV